MSRIYWIVILLGCGNQGRLVGGPPKCAVDAECSGGLQCINEVCDKPSQPLGEAPPTTSQELYGRVRQSEFSLDRDNPNARQELLFRVGVGKQHGFELTDALQDARFNLRFEGDQGRIWAMTFSVPGKEVVVPSLPGESTPDGRFLLKDIRIRLPGDALAPMLWDAFPKASAEFRAPLVVNARMGQTEANIVDIELAFEDVLIKVDLDVLSRRLTAHVVINEQRLLYGQRDGLYIDGFALDAVLEGVVLPSTWVAQ